MKIIYKKKIVAFIDVLGFSNLVFSTKLEPIQNYFEIITTSFSDATVKKQIEFIVISDSIVVHDDLTKQNFGKIVSVLSQLQHKLLHKGILVRGGVSCGDLHFDKTKNIIVGDGLINAYALEGLACYPRIIIDRKLIPQFWEGTTSFERDMSHLLNINPIGPYDRDFPYIDYTKDVPKDFQVHKFDSIIRLLNTHYYDKTHFHKYLWLQAHLLENSIQHLKKLEAIKPQKGNIPRKINLLTKFISELQKL